MPNYACIGFYTRVHPWLKSLYWFYVKIFISTNYKLHFSWKLVEQSFEFVSDQRKFIIKTTALLVRIILP